MVLNTITPAVLGYSPPDLALEEFTPARDRAFFADPEKKSLLSHASAIEELTPYIGTELKGIQLSQLSDSQRDELALLVAERGVVFLRDQDMTLDQQHALAAHYGVVSRNDVCFVSSAKKF
jgi:sulfonate dioxygenase